MEIQKNDRITLEITGMTAEGNGVGRYHGIAIFVPGSAVGDQLEIHVLKTARTHAFGKIYKIISPSPHRIPVDCPQFAQCGGCVYRHISYAEETRVKQQRIEDAFSRIGGFADLPVRPIIVAEEPNHYRNKAQLPIGNSANGGLSLGFYASRSHRIIPCSQCLLQPPKFAAAINAFQEWAAEAKPSVYDESSHKGRLRHFCLREAKGTGEVMACVVVNAGGVPNEADLTERLRRAVPGLKSVVINSNRERTNVIWGPKCRTAWGSDTITDTLCGLSFRISPLSFYQVNHDQAERLYEIAAQYAGLTGKETILDLYCGAGTIGLSMARNAQKVIGVEIVEQAVEDAAANAALNQIHNVEFLCADAAQAAHALAERGEKPDVVIVDPPRKGCSPSLLHTVAKKMAPQRIVYVSCDPATLARDVKLLNSIGYHPEEATPVDMFPRTAHVECVMVMSKNK